MGNDSINGNQVIKIGLKKGWIPDLVRIVSWNPDGKKAIAATLLDNGYKEEEGSTSFRKEGQMPYTTQEARSKVNNLIQQVFDNTETKGDVNYCITKLVHLWAIKQLKDFWNGAKKYTVLDEALGIFNSAGKVFFRTILGPYETEAMRKNGNISELDYDYYEMEFNEKEKEN